MEFQCSVPRKLARVWLHWKWFLKLHNVSFSDSSFIRYVQNPKIPRIQPTHSYSHQIGSIWCKMVKSQKYCLSIRFSQYLDSEKCTYMNQCQLSQRKKDRFRVETVKIKIKNLSRIFVICNRNRMFPLPTQSTTQHDVEFSFRRN